MASIPPGVGPRFPQVVILVGATGDLSRRKLLPGLFHLCATGFMPGCRIIGVSLDEMDSDAFRGFAHDAVREFFAREICDDDWTRFAANIQYLPLSAGAASLREASGRGRA